MVPRRFTRCILQSLTSVTGIRTMRVLFTRTSCTKVYAFCVCLEFGGKRGKRGSLLLLNPRQDNDNNNNPPKKHTSEMVVSNSSMFLSVLDTITNISVGGESPRIIPPAYGGTDRILNHIMMTADLSGLDPEQQEYSRLLDLDDTNPVPRCFRDTYLAVRRLILRLEGLQDMFRHFISSTGRGECYGLLTPFIRSHAKVGYHFSSPFTAR